MSKLIVLSGIIVMPGLSACKKQTDDGKTYTDTFKKSFGGNSSDVSKAVFQTADGGYLLAGNTMSNNSGDVGENKGRTDIFIVKTDPFGNKIWQKSYGGSDLEIVSAITGTSDGGFIIAASTFSINSGDVGFNHGDPDMWVFKIDANGKLVWQKTFGGSDNEYAYDIKGTPDGGFLVAGFTSSSMSGDVGLNHSIGIADAWLIKLDAEGRLLWERCYGGVSADGVSSVILTADGGVLIGGFSSTDNNGDVGPNKGLEDLWVIKTDDKGELLWQKTLGGAGDETSKGMVQTADGGYIIVGNTNSNNSGDVGVSHGDTDIWVVKLDVNGNLQWQKVIGGSKIDEAVGIVKSSGGDYIIVGNTWSSNSGDVGVSQGYRNIWLVKLSANGTITGQDLMGVDNNPYGSGGSIGYASKVIAVSDSYLVLAAAGVSQRMQSGDESDMYVVKTKMP